MGGCGCRPPPALASDGRELLGPPTLRLSVPECWWEDDEVGEEETDDEEEEEEELAILGCFMWPGRRVVAKWKSSSVAEVVISSGLTQDCTRNNFRMIKYL